jgi:hypothetical protein
MVFNALWTSRPQPGGLVNYSIPKETVRIRSYPFRLVLRLGGGLLLIFILSLLTIFILLGMSDHDDRFYKILAVFIPAYAAILATSGWVISAWMQDRTSTRQHTINVLFATNFTNELFARNRRLVDSRFPETETVTLEQFTSLNSSAAADDNAVADAIRYLLNYFEYISASVRIKIWMI